MGKDIIRCAVTSAVFLFKPIPFLGSTVRVIVGMTTIGVFPAISWKTDLSGTLAWSIGFGVLAFWSLIAFWTLMWRSEGRSKITFSHCNTDVLQDGTSKLWRLDRNINNEGPDSSFEATIQWPIQNVGDGNYGPLDNQWYLRKGDTNCCEIHRGKFSRIHVMKVVSEKRDFVDAPYQRFAFLNPKGEPYKWFSGAPEDTAFTLDIRDTNRKVHHTQRLIVNMEHGKPKLSLVE